MPNLDSSSAAAAAATVVVVDQIKERYNLACRFYNENFYETNFISTLSLIVYFPLGILIMLVRFSLICLLYVCVNLVPSLQYNSVFVRLVSLTLGVFISECVYSNKQSVFRRNTTKIFASNHVTCLDYLAIKCGAVDSNYNEHTNLNRSATNAETSKLFARVSMFFTGILHLNENSKSTKSNFIYFPESIATNGSNALLMFDSSPFELPDSAYSACVPVCLRVERCWSLLPFSVNYIHSNDLVNVLLSMFLPYTSYQVEFLGEQFMNENETSKQFAERVRSLIADRLHLTRSELSHEGLRHIFLNYKQHLANEQRQQQQQQNEMSRRSHNSTRRSTNNSISFGDVSRVALQIKDILPDVSFEMIKHHINISASLDIDTLIASILDSNEPLVSESSTRSRSQTDASASSATIQPTVKPTPKNTYKSYEERKFTLLNESRQRYLSKHKQ